MKTLGESIGATLHHGVKYLWSEILYFVVNTGT